MSANSKQVAGTHYQTSEQHWDLIGELRSGYFEGQISKYLTRHRKKNGKVDAEKALHFVDKLRELQALGQKPIGFAVRMDRLERYAKANGMTPLDTEAVMRSLNWRSDMDLLNLRMCVVSIVAQYGKVNAVLHTPAHHANDGAEPGAGYVNQDR